MDRYEFLCPSCQAILRVPLTAAGLTGKCRSCQEIITAPAPPASIPVAAGIDDQPARKAKIPLQNLATQQAKQTFRRRFTADSLAGASHHTEPVSLSSDDQTPFADINTAKVKTQKFQLPEDVHQKTYFQRDHSLPTDFTKKASKRQTLVITIGLLTAAMSFFLYSLGWRLK